MLNPLNLSMSDIEELLYLGEGWLCDGIESAILVSEKTEKCAAIYKVEFSDDGSFPDEESRIEGTQVFICYKPNGELIAKL